MYRQVVFIVFVGLFLVAGLSAQTTINPDVSVIGDIHAFSHNDASRAVEKEKLNLATPEMELMVAGYLNPYARAGAVVAWHGEHNAEVEEIYATILRGLPLNMNVRAGKYLLEFGRLNPVHPHAWSFMKRPLPHEHFFGSHGLSDMAVRAAFLLPTGDAYTEIMAALLKGDALLGHHHHGEEEEQEVCRDSVHITPGFFGRLTTSFALTDFTELALGMSVLNSVSHLHLDTTTSEIKQLRSWVAGVDAKYKHKPSRYTTLQIEAEGLLRSDEQEDGDRLSSYGGYGYIDYRFHKIYNLGSIFEYVRHKEHEEEEGSVQTHTIWRAGLFAGFAPIEETSLVRLIGHWTKPKDADGFWEVNVQLVFSLGPHQPHNF